MAQRLQRAPRVFTLQLAWRSHLEAPEDIGAALRALDSLVRGRHSSTGHRVARPSSSLHMPLPHLRLGPCILPSFPASPCPSPPPKLSLDEVYQGEAAAGRRYRLRSLVGYSGQHYSAFVALPELGGE